MRDWRRSFDVGIQHLIPFDDMFYDKKDNLRCLLCPFRIYKVEDLNVLPTQ